MRVFPIFSAKDADLGVFHWFSDDDGYASRNGGVNGVKKYFMAHRVVYSRVLGRDLLRTEIVDHGNHNILDCRRGNLRLTTKAGNTQNRKPNPMRGVVFHKRMQKWQSQVGHMGKRHYCGWFATPEEAAEAAKRKRAELGFLQPLEMVGG